MSYKSLYEYLNGGDRNTDNTYRRKINTFFQMIEQYQKEYILLADKSKNTESVEIDFDNNLQIREETEETMFGDIFDELKKDNSSEISQPVMTKEEEMMKHFDEEDKAKKQVWSEKGKKRYKEADIDDKIQILLNMKSVDMEKILDPTSNCDLNKLRTIINGEAENKGFTILQAGTTGFGAGNQPTQISMRTYAINKDGTFKAIAGTSFMIQADKESLEKAVKIADNGGFDVFAHGGINREEYLQLCEAGKSDKERNFYTSAIAAQKIEAYFSKGSETQKENYPTDKYPIISAGSGSRNKEISFSQEALKKICNTLALSSPSVDFSQVIKEYTILVHSNPDYENQNVLFPDNQIPAQLDNFKLETIAEANGIKGEKIAGAKAKCLFMMNLIQKIQEQYLAIDRQIETPKATKTEPNYNEVVFKAEMPMQQSVHSFNMNEAIHDFDDNSAESTQTNISSLNENISSLTATVNDFKEQMQTPQHIALEKQQTHQEAVDSNE